MHGTVRSISGEETRLLEKGFTIPNRVSALMKACKVPSKDLERGAQIKRSRGGAKSHLALHYGKLRQRKCELRILEDTKDHAKLKAFLEEVVVRHELEHPQLRKFLGISTFPAYTIVLSDTENSCTLRDLLWKEEGFELSLHCGLADILCGVASGLGRVHSARAVHGSISADVVLVTMASGSTQAVLDGLETVTSNIPQKFGIFPLEVPLEIPRAGGKWYQAPEVLRGEAPRMKSDVFSLGMVRA